MSCNREMQLLISCYVDGEATQAEVVRAEEHLAGCATCRNLLEHWQGEQQLFTWAYTRAFDEEISMETLLRKAGKETRQPMSEIIRKPFGQLTLPHKWAWLGTLAALFIAGVIYLMVTMLSFLPVGRVLITEAHSRAARMDWSVALTVEPYSHVRCLSRHVLRVEQGWVEATVQHGRNFRIVTPRLSVLDRGTRFYVGSGPKSDYVIVEDGAVEVQVGQARQRLTAGQVLFADDRGAPIVTALPALLPKEEADYQPLASVRTVFPITAEDARFQ